MEYNIKGFVNCLSDIANAYKKQGNPKHYTYNKAIQSIKDLGYSESLTRLNNNLKIPYIGESILEKYREYVRTGYIKKMKELNIKTTVSENKHKNYMLRTEAEKLVKPLYTKISKYSTDITYVGSYRRNKDYIGDMDMLVISRNLSFLDIFTNKKKDDKLKLNKSTQITILAIGDNKMKVLLENLTKHTKIEVDLRIFRKIEKATALLYFTGSASENIKLRSIAKRNNMKLSEYGITTLSDNVLHHFNSEKAVYKFLGCQYKEPKDR